LDFVKPAVEIFEQRDRQLAQKLHEEAVKKSVDYKKELRVKPYQKKAYLEILQVTPNEDQIEILS